MSMQNKPKLYILGINYAPELVGIGPFTAQMAEALACQWEVHAFTSFPYYPKWEKIPLQTPKTEGTNPKITRFWNYVPSRPKILFRLLHELLFAFQIFFYLLVHRRPSKIIVVAPPIFLAYAAYVLGVIWRVPVLVHFQDIQPDAALALYPHLRSWFSPLFTR